MTEPTFDRDAGKGGVMGQAIAFVCAQILEEAPALDIAFVDPVAALKVQHSIKGAGLGLFAAYSMLVQATGAQPSKPRPCDLLPAVFTHGSQMPIKVVYAQLNVIAEQGWDVTRAGGAASWSI